MHAPIHCVSTSDNRISTYVDASVDGGNIACVLTRSHVDGAEDARSRGFMRRDRA